MAGGKLRAMLRHIRKLAGAPASAGVTDGQLLERFVTERDEAAFELLVRRHERMVWGVCWRLLANSHDVEDAFQAAFVVLVRKARTVRKRDSLGCWLHQVAYRVALRAGAYRAKIAEREQHSLDLESAADPHDLSTEMIGRELRPLLDQELSRLPEKYRAPVVLCYLEGISYEEAGQQLRCSKGTVSTRLRRARELLRRRLIRRGLSLTTGLLATAFAQEAGAGAVPATLIASTLRSVLALGIHGAILGSGVPAPVAALASDLLHALWVTKVELALAIVLAGSVLGAGAGLAVHQAWMANAGGKQQPDAPRPMVQRKDAPLPKPLRPERTDLYGDPLPPGALVRMGTLRLRHPTMAPSVAFSADGKTLISANPEGVRFWDVSTGKPLDRNTPEPPGGGTYTLSPDGRILVTRHQSELRLLDVNAGKELRRLPVEGVFTTAFAWAADRKTLAAVIYDRKNYAVQAWDVESGKKYLVLEHPRRIDALALSPDGQVLASGDAQDTLRLFEVRNGREHRKLRTAATGLTFSAEGKILASGDAQGSVKLWDVATGQERSTVSAPAAGRIELLSFTPDGSTLAVRGNTGLSLCDVRSGRERYHLPVSGTMRFAPDGKTLVTQSGGRIQLWDVATGKELLNRPGHYAEVYAVVFTPDGKVLASASRNDGEPMIWLWDGATGKALYSLEGHSPSVSRDGKRMIAIGKDGMVRFWDRSTDKELCRFVSEDVDGGGTLLPCVTYRLSPDGARLITISSGLRPQVKMGIRLSSFQMDVWDTATGNLLTRRAFLGEPRFYSSPQPQLLPDARSVMVRTENGFAIEDVATGRELLVRPGELSLGPTCFSTDGRFLAAPLLASGSAGGFGQGDAVGVWELATGKEFMRLKTGLVGPIAFAPDGRLLAAAGLGAIRLWDIPTGKEVLPIQLPPNLRTSYLGQPRGISSLTFSPDGKTLATGLLDGSILIWDVAPETRQAGSLETRLSPKELETLWADLAGEDGRKAQAAVWTFVAMPQTTVPLLKKNLQPAQELAPDRLRRLLSDLDSTTSAVREAASKELEQLGDVVEPALHRALQEEPSTEARKRIEALLARPRVVSTPEVLRCLRAIHVLEAIGSAEARQVLQHQATGASAARETQEAKAALERLALGNVVRP